MFVMWREVGVWCVGFITPASERWVVYEFDDKEAAATKVHYLNGGN